MKKLLLGLFVVILLTTQPGLVFGQEYSSGGGVSGAVGIARPVMPIKPPPVYQGAGLPFGQSHFYTVTLRGNGQALVFLKTVFSNREEASLSAQKFTFPEVPENLSVYQVIREPQCVSYMPIAVTPEMKGSLRYPNPLPQPECAQYQEPDYSYGWGNSTYQKAKFELNNRDLTVELPKKVKPNGSGGLILVYSLPGITSKDFIGAYDFSFDTVKVEDAIQNLQVGLMVDPDYFLKDTKGEINYQTKEASIMSAPTSMAYDAGGRVSNPQFDQFYNQIGQGTIVKSVNNLQPNEPYNIKGSYADNKLMLYGKEIGIGIGVVALVFILAIGSLFIAVKKVFGKKPDDQVKQDSSRSSIYLVILGASFGSSLFILLYTLGVYFFSVFIIQMFQYYSFNTIYPLFMILILVISLCIFSVFLFAPAVVIGIKKGILPGLFTLILTIFWLIFYSVVLIGIIFIFFQNPYNQSYPVPMPMMGFEKGAVDSVSAGSRGTMAVPPVEKSEMLRN